MGSGEAVLTPSEASTAPASPRRAGPACLARFQGALAGVAPLFLRPPAVDEPPSSHRPWNASP